jgi:hypothetical protein
VAQLYRGVCEMLRAKLETGVLKATPSAVPQNSGQNVALPAEVTALFTRTHATSSSHWNFLPPAQIATPQQLKNASHFMNWCS